MCARILSLLLVVVVLGVQAQWHFQPPKREGEECGRIGDQVWTCQKENDCSSLSFLSQRSRRITCNKISGERITCCPVSSNSRVYSNSISEKKCSEYQARRTCTRNRVDLLEASRPPFPGLIPDDDEDGDSRRRREINNFEEEEDDEDIYLPDPGMETTTDVAIMGGRRADPKELPHSARIGFGAEDKITWNCGGTLISERFVLSAAHCASAKLLGPARWVRVGDLDFNSDTDDARIQQFTIIDRIVHPGYSDKAYYNDIALFKLDRPAVFDDYVHPACLYNSLDTPFGQGTASGWGKLGITLPESSHLMKVELNFIRCSEELALWNYTKNNLPRGVDHDTMVCAYALDKDACAGDSGGPLILADWSGKCVARLVGVISVGLDCRGDNPVSGIYTRVAAYRPWIEKIVWPLTPSRG